MGEKGREEEEQRGRRERAIEPLNTAAQEDRDARVQSAAADALERI